VEGDKVKGMGWFLLVWFATFLAMCTILAFLPGCLSVEPLKADCGDYNSGFAAGYQKAQSELVCPIPVKADVELKLWDSKAQIQAFLKADQCDRCLSSVPTEGPEWACLERAECLLSASRNAGYDGYGVVMNFASAAHAIVAFPLKDGSLVFCEPWTDQIVPTPVVGGDYINHKNVIEKIVVLR
jgi:hypothetical protein